MAKKRETFEWWNQRFQSQDRKQGSQSIAEIGWIIGNAANATKSEHIKL